ncbi:alpha/beta fold hydrolase, partial [Actinopolymorpha cephalotaxi]|uniref:alpha/beta fold hydrolase n=1 Tax=Actinopolymorpha cephalotaxi TaxID=504797 RepID=UPI003630168C
MTSQNAGPATTRPRKAAGTLEVPGAHLYYETWGFEGSGNPLLLLIPGGLGDAGFYSSIGPALAGDYRVVTYDRRGNSRSTVASPHQQARIGEQIADALALLDLLGGTGQDDQDDQNPPRRTSSAAAAARSSPSTSPRHPHAYAPSSRTSRGRHRAPDASAHLARFEELRALHRTDGTEQAMAAFNADHAGSEQDSSNDPGASPTATSCRGSPATS